MNQQNENLEIISIFASLPRPIPIELSYQILDYAEKWVPISFKVLPHETTLEGDFSILYDNYVDDYDEELSCILSSASLNAKGVASLRKFSFNFKPRPKCNGICCGCRNEHCIIGGKELNFITLLPKIVDDLIIYEGIRNLLSGIVSTEI